MMILCVNRKGVQRWSTRTARRTWSCSARTPCTTRRASRSTEHPPVAPPAGRAPRVLNLARFNHDSPPFLPLSLLALLFTLRFFFFFRLYKFLVYFKIVANANVWLHVKHRYLNQIGVSAHTNLKLKLNKNLNDTFEEVNFNTLLYSLFSFQTSTILFPAFSWLICSRVIVIIL